MQVTHESVSGHMIKITIKESSTEMEHYKKLAALEIAEARQFPGFRKGDDVPTEVVAREIGEDRLMQEALNRALQTLYPKALKKLSIHPVDMGEISDIASISPLEVTLMIEVVPEIALDIKKTEKIRIPMPQVSVSDEDLETELNEMLKRGTHYHPRGHHHGHTHDENGDLPDSTDTAIQMHDKVRVNAVGYDKKGGTADARMSLQDFEITIGANMMIPGFEEALIGAKEGDTVEFEVTFPKDYHSTDFAGKQAFFVCTILSVEYPHTPAWTPEFIAHVWGKPLEIADFRAEYRENMLRDRREKARSEAEDKLVTELLAIHPIELGTKIVTKEVENLWQYHNSEIQKQGMDIATYLEHMRTSEDEFKKTQIEPVAINRVKSMLILEALKKHYAPSIEDDAVTAEIRTVFARYAQNPDFEQRILELAKPGTQHFEDVKSRLEYRMVIDRFVTDSDKK